MHIILIGFMGVGKSTVGRALAQRMARPFYDLDHLIESGETVSIPTIIKDEGISYFRHVESVYLESVLAREPGVVATGGGAVQDDDNRERMKDHKVIWLDASSATLTRRLAAMPPRPLLKEITEESVAKRLQERLPFYQELGIRVDVDKKSVEDVVTQIYETCHSNCR